MINVGDGRVGNGPAHFWRWRTFLFLSSVSIFRFFFNDLRFSSSLSVASDTCNDDVVIGTDLKKISKTKEQRPVLRGEPSIIDFYWSQRAAAIS